MASGETLLLGEMLVAKGLINVSELERALQEHKRTGDFLGATLVKLGLINEEVLMPVLSQQLGIRCIKIADLKIDPAVISKMPAKFASHYKMMPINLQDNILTVGVLNPLDMHTLDDIRLLLDCEIDAVLCGEKDILDAIRKYYGIGAE
ncbi:MAG: hypothetical protein NTV07_03610, partial [Candidatus Omnitrophica bacterium]|nr:hypothetical protein [Candidatus Omnitrophota bacterium]